MDGLFESWATTRFTRIAACISTNARLATLRKLNVCFVFSLPEKWLVCQLLAELQVRVYYILIAVANKRIPTEDPYKLLLPTSRSKNKINRYGITPLVYFSQLTLLSDIFSFCSWGSLSWVKVRNSQATIYNCCKNQVLWTIEYNLQINLNCNQLGVQSLYPVQRLS